MKRNMKRDRPTAKKPLTPRQRLAIERRAAEREFRNALASIEKNLTSPFYGIPPNHLAKTAKALNIILHGGHVFVLACAKAYLSRSYPLPRNDEIWSFIDDQNAQFAACVPSDIVARWNAPDYDLPEKGGQK